MDRWRDFSWMPTEFHCEDGDRLVFVIKSKQNHELDEWGNIMKKISTCLLALLLLVASISVTQAAGLNELTETKVQLEDSLDADGFAAAYNKVSAYPIAGDLTKRVQGNYISYFAGIDASTVMIINANQVGRLSNIVIADHGAIDAAEQEKLRGVFDCTLTALGLKADENNLFFANQAFDRLSLTNDTLLAARLPREETKRTWTFLKAVNPEKQVTTILIEAVVDQNP